MTKSIIYILSFLLTITLSIAINSCVTNTRNKNKEPLKTDSAIIYPAIDTALIPKDKFGDMVRYGRQLMLNTAYYIGPNGVNGKYLGNKMNCTNCHQEAGTKPYSFSLLMSHSNYPQYRAREGKVLTLAERVNNCITHPHIGKPLPLDSKEMIAFLSYLKWINSFAPKTDSVKGIKNLSISFPDSAANSAQGEVVYKANCARCHGANGEGVMDSVKGWYVYPPLWGDKAYQPGSSMHRVIMMARWLKANMPYDKVVANKPFLTDAEALDVAAFVNNDLIHKRPPVKDFEYPNAKEKTIDYDRAPFVDSFSAEQHKYGPYPPIIKYWKEHGLTAKY